MHTTVTLWPSNWAHIILGEDDGLFSKVWRYSYPICSGRKGGSIRCLKTIPIKMTTLMVFKFTVLKSFFLQNVSQIPVCGSWWFKILGHYGSQYGSLSEVSLHKLTSQQPFKRLWWFEVHCVTDICVRRCMFISLLFISPGDSLLAEPLSQPQPIDSICSKCTWNFKMCRYIVGSLFCHVWLTHWSLGDLEI